MQKMMDIPAELSFTSECDAEARAFCLRHQDCSSAFTGCWLGERASLVVVRVSSHAHQSFETCSHDVGGLMWLFSLPRQSQAMLENPQTV